MKGILTLVTMFLILCFSSCQSEQEVTIGYQLMANPWKVLIADGKLDKLAGKKVKFVKFNSGAKVINAMASGDIDIAIAGSTSVAAAFSQELDLKLVWVMEIIGDAEALVVREGINKIEDLKGKNIAVPFGSTTHFHLMVALDKAGLTSKDVKVLNLSPPGIVASWKKKEIDAAFVWAPALEEIKTDGNVLLSSKKLAEAGTPTFDGILVRDSFFQGNKKVVSEFVSHINKLHQSYNENPWKQDGNQVETVANFLGSSKENVFTALQGYVFPTFKTQPSQNLEETIKNTAQFLKAQDKIDAVLESYQSKIQVLTN